MKRKYLIILISILMLIFSLLGISYIFKKQNKNITFDEKKTNNISNIVLNEKGNPLFLSGEEIDIKVYNNDDTYKVLESLKEFYGIENSKNEFNILSVNDALNFKFYKLNQKINGITVYGKQLVLTVNEDNKLLSVTGNYYPDLKPLNKIILTEKEATETLVDTLNLQDNDIKNINKYVYINNDNAFYTYFLKVDNEDGSVDYIINAEDGKIIDKIHNVNRISEVFKANDIFGDEQSIPLEIDGNVNNLYHFYDEKRNIMIADIYGTPINLGNTENINWINSVAYIMALNAKDVPFRAYKNSNDELSYNAVINSEEDFNKVKNAVSAMANFIKTYDYYKGVLGRTSYNDNGAQIVANIGLQYDLFALGKNNDYENASWNGGDEAEFYFGSYKEFSFASALDIVAHEFTHAVTEYTSNLEYKNESGALNEAYSDIMASLIEGKNFTVAEEIYTLRDMANPNKFSNPAEKGGKYYFPDDTSTYNVKWQENILKLSEEAGNVLNDWKDWDHGGVHTNSNVPNHAAYLMYKNGAFSDKEEMAKVWYLSMFILTKTSNFEDCALAVIQAAKMQGLSEDKIKIIEDAFVKTKMLDLKYTTLEGKVTDAETKKGIELALVTLINKKNIYLNYSVQADESGNYKFEKVPDGDYTIVFEKAKYKSTEKEITLKTENKNEVSESLSKIDQSDVKASDIVFVLDISASMTDSDPSDIRKQMIVNIISSLDDETSVALVTFTKTAKTVNNGLSYKNLNKKILMTDVFNISNDDGMNVNSGTNGRMGLNEALLLFNKNKKSRKYIVFFTDGEDTYDDGPSYDELISKANAMDIRILSVGLNANGKINQTELSRLADATNGKYYLAKDSSDMYNFDANIFKELE